MYFILLLWNGLLLFIFCLASLGVGDVLVDELSVSNIWSVVVKEESDEHPGIDPSRGFGASSYIQSFESKKFSYN